MVTALMAGQAGLLPGLSEHIAAIDNLKFSIIPYASTILTPVRLQEYVAHAPLFSFTALRLSIFLIQAMTLSGLSLVNSTDVKLVALLSRQHKMSLRWIRKT
jgi:hypothetical protein